MKKTTPKKRTMKKPATRRPAAKSRPGFYGLHVGDKVVVMFQSPQFDRNDREGVVTKIPTTRTLGGKVSVRMGRSKQVRQFEATEIQPLAEFDANLARVKRIRAQVEGALKGLGYKFRSGSNEGAFTDYQYTENLHFESPNDGAISVSLSPNFFG